VKYKQRLSKHEAAFNFIITADVVFLWRKLLCDIHGDAHTNRTSNSIGLDPVLQYRRYV
jgi:hypothetical protein